MTYKAASPWTKTVELQPHELPPPPKAIDRVRDCLERAMLWAPDAGADVIDAIREALAKTQPKGRAA